MTSLVIVSSQIMSQRESEAEERQNLLSGEGGESEEQPPSHLPPPPLPVLPPPVLPPPILPPPHETYHSPKYNEPPPAYVAAILPQYHGYPAAPGMGVPVEIQVEGGQVVPGTLVQEPTGKHMVYIGEQSSQGPPPPPKDYLGLALLGIICCCCFPIAIVALLKSLEVHKRYHRGDYQGAERASRQAHSWGATAVAISACIIIIFVILRIYSHEYHLHHQYSTSYYNYHYN